MLSFCERFIVSKLYLSIGLFLAASILCSACGLKNDLYMPEEGQASVQLVEPTDEFGLELMLSSNE